LSSSLTLLLLLLRRYEYVVNLSKDFEWERRGTVDIKGKGSLETYFMKL